LQIANLVYRLPPIRTTSWLESIALPFADAVGTECYPLRFSIVDLNEHEIVLESSVVRFSAGDPHAVAFSTKELIEPRVKAFPCSPFAVVQVVPTGLRCEIGGYAGDAGPVTNLLASAADLLITHPNAVNASELNEMAENVLYVEGKALDDFLLGYLGLARVSSNKIGTFVDPTGAQYLDYITNVLNAGIAVKGLDCGSYLILDQELGVEIEWSETGCAVGKVLHPEAILRGVEILLSQDVQAIGGVSVIHGVAKEMFARHLAGEIPNPSGGVEAIITHLISKVFRVPTAHAPLPYYQQLKGKNTSNPRAAAEFISTPHYFSVLKGLAKAPRLIPLSSLHAPNQLITMNNVGAIVVPASCLGGIPALAAEHSNIPLIAVRDNASVLSVTNEKMRMSNVVEVDSYLEAAGVVLAIREGMSLNSLRRPLSGARRVTIQH
jgi:Protein of unknown function (DUF3326)